MKLAAVYTRVSTPEQERSGTSLESQSRACHEYAARQGYRVVLEASDTYTGRTLSRAGLTRIMDGARAGEVEVVVCYAIDRTSRDLADLLMLDRELTRHGVTLEFVADRRDRTPAGNLFFQMRGVFAEYERSQIIERTRRGKETRIRRGEIIDTGHVPYGYTYDKQGRTFRVHEERAATVRLMYLWIAHEGYTLNRVAVRLNEMGVSAPRTARYWRVGTVRTIVRSEVYVGRWAWNKRRLVPARRDRQGNVGPEGSRSKQERPRSEWIYVDVPAIIDGDTWARVQSQLQRNRELATRNRRHHYLLANVVWCERCGARMHGHKKADRKYYRCSDQAHMPREARRPTVGHVLRADALDCVVWGEVVRRITDPQTVERVEAEWDPEEDNGAHEATRIESAAHKLAQERERLLDVYVTGDIDREAFTSRMEVLRRREGMIERERESLGLREQARRDALREQADIMAMLGPVLETNPALLKDPEKRRALVLALNVRVMVDAAAMLAHIRDWPWPPVTVAIPRVAYGKRADCG